MTVAVDSADHIALARWVAARFLRRQPQFAYMAEDVQSEAMVGLVRAARTFDAGRGAKFSTYATRCIYVWLMDWARNDGHVDRLPVSAQKRGERRNAVVSLNRELPNGTLAELLTAPVDRTVEVVEAAEEVTRRLERLSPTARAAVEAHYLGEVSLWHVGRAILGGRSAQRANQLIKRALSDMRRARPAIRKRGKA